MNCLEFESMVNPYLDGELASGDLVSVNEHLAHCGTCGHRAQVAQHNLSIIRAAVLQAGPAAPEGLRARVRDGLHGEESRLRRRFVGRLLAAAAGLALAGVVGHHQWRSFQSRLYLVDAAQRHARHYPLEIEQPSPEQLEAWFGGKLDYRVNLPRFVNATAAGARLLNVREKPAAYIRYDAAPAGQLGLFVFGDDGRDVDVGTLPEPELGTSHGYNVVSWRDGDVVYQLVTDLDERDIRELLPPQQAAPGVVAPRHPTLDLRPASLHR